MKQSVRQPKVPQEMMSSTPQGGTDVNLSAARRIPEHNSGSLLSMTRLGIPIDNGSQKQAAMKHKENFREVKYQDMEWWRRIHIPHRYNIQFGLALFFFLFPLLIYFTFDKHIISSYPTMFTPFHSLSYFFHFFIYTTHLFTTSPLFSYVHPPLESTENWCIKKRKEYITSNQGDFRITIFLI